jgi:hypothetical protein
MLLQGKEAGCRLWVEVAKTNKVFTKARRQSLPRKTEYIKLARCPARKLDNYTGRKVPYKDHAPRSIDLHCCCFSLKSMKIGSVGGEFLVAALCLMNERRTVSLVGRGGAQRSFCEGPSTSLVDASRHEHLTTRWVSKPSIGSKTLQWHNDGQQSSSWALRALQ